MSQPENSIVQETEIVHPIDNLNKVIEIIHKSDEIKDLLSKIDPKILVKLDDKQKEEFLQFLINSNSVKPILNNLFSEKDLILENLVAKQIFEIGMEWTKTNILSHENVISLTTMLMKQVEIKANNQPEQNIISKDKIEKKKFIIGPIKKNIVICVVKLIIENVDCFNPFQKEILLTYVDKFLSQVIDVIVSISNGDFNINNMDQIDNSCFPIFCSK